MYAIVQSGGKQYRVSEGDFVDVERLSGEVGQQVNFDNVLAVGHQDGIQFGTPTLSTAKVVGTIADHGKSKKILVFKFKRRKMYRRKQGHRQLFTRVRIDEIALTGVTKPTRQDKASEAKPEVAVKAKTTAEKATTTQKAPTQKAAAKKAPAKKAPTKKVATKKAKSSSAKVKKSSARSAAKKATGAKQAKKTGK